MEHRVVWRDKVFYSIRVAKSVICGVIRVVLRTVLNAFSCALIVVCALAPPVLGETQEEEALSVTRDRDRTVYTIGETKQEEDPDKERAWEMLKDIRIWTRENDGKGTNTGR
jgi:hypothetical protein